MSSDPNNSGTPRRLADVARDWRPEGGTPSARRRAQIRRWKVGGVLAILLAIVVGLVWLISLGRDTLPRIRFIGVGITRYEALPPHPCGEADVSLLSQVFGEWNQIDPARVNAVESMDSSLEDGQFLGEG